MSVHEIAAVYRAAEGGAIERALSALEHNRPSQVTAVAVAAFLADRYRREPRWYVDETAGQVAAACGLTPGTARKVLAALNRAGVWVVVRKGGRDRGGSRRVPGPALQPYIGSSRQGIADGPESLAGHSADSPSVTECDDRVTGDSGQSDRGVTHPQPPELPPTEGADASLFAPSTSGEEGIATADSEEPRQAQAIDELIIQAVRIVASNREPTRGPAGAGAIKNLTCAAAAEAPTVRRWGERGSSPTNIRDALAERIAGNPHASPRDLRGIVPVGAVIDDQGQPHPELCGCGPDRRCAARQVVGA